MKYSFIKKNLFEILLFSGIFLNQASNREKKAETNQVSTKYFKNEADDENLIKKSAKAIKKYSQHLLGAYTILNISE